MSDKENLQPLGENEAAEKEEERLEYDRTLCSLCQKKEREEGSYYCEDCRTKMMKTKIKGGAVVAAVLCVIVSLFSLMLLGANATQMVALLEADSHEPGLYQRRTQQGVPGERGERIPQ